MRKKESGATIVVVISVIATLAVFVGAALDYTFAVAKDVERSNKISEATAIANGCLQYQFMYWREICRTHNTQALGTSYFSSIPLPTSTQFPNVSNFTATTGSGSSYTVSNYTVSACNAELTPLTGSTSPPAGVDATGTNKTYFYEANVTVNLPDRGINVALTASQIFEQQYESPWEWAIFFADPLEIEPGEPMTVDGWVQTNSNLYTPLNNLTFGSQANYGLGWYITAMPGDQHLIGDGDTYADPNWPAGLPPSQATPTQPFGLIPSDIFAGSSSNPNVTDAYHELIEPPVLTSADPLAGYRYFDNAGAKILMTLGNSGGVSNVITAYVYDKSGSETYVSSNPTMSDYGNIIGTITYTPAYTKTQHGQTTNVAASTTLSETHNDSTYQQNLASTLYNAMTFNQSIQDNREGQSVAITELNVGTITSAVTANNLSGFNGVVYIDDEASTSSAERAIELTNGAQLPSGGLTFASGNPVYIQGDYNTTSTGGRASASVVADAVDILSNAWSNSNSTSTLSSRPATDTTVNTAIMSGIVPTSNGNYSGGAENFPRFLEDWSNATLTYYGSMVELYPSQQATGMWGQSNVYNPPTRVWHFDTNFQVSPPPGTLMLVKYVRGQWYYQ
ncbi:MAG: hypothetical protein ABSE62_00365 [Chthoniobacteraceae bacterium]|jgi:hypothetical protein